MPIRPENRHRYPKNWREISQRIRDRAQYKCEQCGIGDGTYIERLGGKLVRIVLTVAHMDHCPENCADDNLKALCQKCHNVYDAPMRARGRKERMRQRCAVGDLFDEKAASGRRAVDRSKNAAGKLLQSESRSAART